MKIEIPTLYQSAGLEDFKEPEVSELGKWAAEITSGTGKGLCLAGPTGTGKTHALWALLRTLDVSGWGGTCAAYTVTDVLERLRPGWWEAWIERTELERPYSPHGHLPRNAGVERDRWWTGLLNAGLLALDDLGVMRPTEWVDEQLFRLIDERHDWLRPMLVTTNWPENKWPERLGDKVASRLSGMCQVIEMRGRDRRRD